MIIRKADASDLDDVLAVEQAAFGSAEEAGLVEALLGDPSAEPIISLLACDEERAVGHILFTGAWLEPACDKAASILAPLAVIPDYQKQGVGRQLTETGIRMLSKTGTDLVFVLGHPEYYPYFGFKPARALGFSAPYPILEKNAGAWMVLALNPDAVSSFERTVCCAKTMDRPEYWRE